MYIKRLNSYLMKSLTVFGLIATLSACSKPANDASTSAAKATSQEKKVVNLAIWSNFVTDEMLKDFETKTGIHAEVSNYSSNEELLAKIQAGASGYDVVVPADYMVLVMAQLNLLAPINHTKISNQAALDPKFMKMYFDTDNKFSLPFDWGTTGIAINRKLFKGELSGWKDVFENKTLAGKYTMLDDVRETLGAALKREGFSLNSKNGDELGKAKQLILKAKKNIKGFTSETLMGLVNGEMAVAHAYSSDALQARQKTNGSIDYKIPAEGCTLWVDNLVIPANAPHIEEAHALINFLLSPEVAAARTTKLFVAPTNKDALKLLPKEVAENSALFPDAKALEKCEMIQDLGESLAQWDRIWTEAKASH